MSKSLNKKSNNESSSDSQNNKIFKRMLQLYLENLHKFTDNNIPEFEIRFGTKKLKLIGKNDFYNVIKTLLNYNFILQNENYHLKIINDNEYSDIRTELYGLPNIQHYCKYDTIIDILDKTNIEFVEKKDYIFENGDKLKRLDFDDYNFRVSYQIEKKYNLNDSTIQKIIDKWKTTKKIYRFLKRYEYIHPKLPFIVHCSVVKTSSTNTYNKYIPTFNIRDANVFNSIEHFEIEIELNNVLISSEEKLKSETYLYDNLKKTIKYILIGLQQTNFPISIPIQNEIISNYLKLIKENKDYDKKALISDFVGPSSSTLQMDNLLNEYDINETNKSIPNIRNNYTVTDKADGLRKLMYINIDGKVYFITTSMNVEFTGCYTEHEQLFNTLIDGEHILHDKNNDYINTFAAFDIYFLKGVNKTGFAFINVNDDSNNIDKDEEEKDKEKKQFRLVILNTIVEKIKLKSIISNTKPSLKFVIKKFKARNIFKACKEILDDIDNGLYEYNTDGLIFTPANTGVASNKIGYSAPKHKVTWDLSFKWKPPEFNTIDFLVKFKKNDFGIYDINKLYIDGSNMSHTIQSNSYFTLILHVGFDPKKHGYINPCNDLLNNYIQKKSDLEELNNEYKPARFYPTNPSDNNAGLCYILGITDESDNLKIYSEDGDEIEDNTIVEFRYNSTKPELWRWEPIRVRHDKTSELRSGIKNFGNAYHVANSNWQSIHNPIIKEIITTGNNIIVQKIDDDIYYNKKNDMSYTRCLRDFHNLYVKTTLLNEFSKIGYTLIDYACGKGGDIPKWISSNLEFILGIDLSKDNIENRIDGTCARYLNYAKKYDIIPKAIFLHGNSSNNIKSGEAFYTDKNKSIIKALFGEGSKNEMILGKNAYNNYGIVKNGFNISSIQFAFHYMFENEIILREFLKNISQCTALDGYFIGTCYDGKKIYNLLNDKSMNESVSLFVKDTKIWQITKRYSFDKYEDDETCVGYAIDVFQESINKTFREYLVNFTYLKRIMENYGFVILSPDEIKKFNIPSSIGSFIDLYNQMKLDIQKNKTFSNKIGKSLFMSEEEKKISFLNNYFIFKKVRNISQNDIDNIENKLVDEDKNQKLNEEIDNIDIQIENIDKESAEEKSKKLAQEYIEKEKSGEFIPKLPNIKPDKEAKQEKIKLNIEDKIKLAEQKKEEKEKQKLLEKEAKKEEKEKQKLLEKEAKKEEKEKQKLLEKEAKKEEKEKQKLLEKEAKKEEKEKQKHLEKESKKNETKKEKDESKKQTKKAPKT